MLKSKLEVSVLLISLHTYAPLQKNGIRPVIFIISRLVTLKQTEIRACPTLFKLFY